MSNVIHLELEKLKKELNSLNTVRQQFNESKELTKELIDRLSTQTVQFQKQVGQTAEQYEKYLRETAEALKKQLDKQAQELSEKTQKAEADFEKYLKETTDSHKIEMAATRAEVEKSVRLASSTLTSLVEKAKLLQDSMDKTEKSLQGMAEHTQTLWLKIDRVDFPSRLDKLDTNVATIGLSLQNMQTQLLKTEEKMHEGFQYLIPQVKSVRLFQSIIFGTLAIVLVLMIVILAKNPS